MVRKFILIFLSLLFSMKGFSQDLLSMLDSLDDESSVTYTTATFKTVRLINGYTTETPGKHDLVFSISHRFGKINTGAYNLFGLDQSTIRFGFEYGLLDRLSLGFGRSNFEKLYDGFIKMKLFKQSSGSKSFPFSLTLLEGIAIKTLKYTNQDIDYPFTSRLYYTHELLISRKFNNNLSLQLMPVIIHRNMVKKIEDENIVPAIGLGGRFKLTKRFSLSGEYYYLLPGKTADEYANSLAIGFNIETGGHVFQLHFSNSLGMTEKSFIPETSGEWSDGDISFGFNIIRVFSLKGKKHLKQ